MKLITNELEKAFQKAPLYSTEKIQTNLKKVVAKFFLPNSRFVWLAVEGSKTYDSEGEGHWLFFGAVRMFDDYEWGYFTLEELENININRPEDVQIQLDSSVQPFQSTAAEVMIS